MTNPIPAQTILAQTNPQSPDSFMDGAFLALFIVVPLVVAGLCTFLPWGWLRRALSLLVPAFGAALSTWMLVDIAVSEGGAATDGTGAVYAENVGNFLGGVAIPLAADTLTALMILATAVVAFAANWFADAVGDLRSRFYPALSMMLLGGAWGALLTADLFNLFVFIEVMLMPSFGLIAMTGTWGRLAGARMFIVVNLVTSLLLVSGVVMTYAVVGTTNLAALAGAGGPRGEAGFAEGIHGTHWQVVVAIGMVLLALAVKAGVTPTHTWLPRAYPSTSPAVMALFSGLHTKVAVYGILRVYMTVFEGDARYSWAIVIIMVIGMFVGGFAGLAENTMRGVLAYQMVNGIPYMLIALGFLTANPKLVLSAALFYLIHHMVIAASLIMAAGSIEETYGHGRLRPLHGLLRRDPFPAAVFAAGALAIVGFPPFSGLWGKLALVFGIAEDGSWKTWLAIGTIIITSIGALLSMIYVWREIFWGRPMNRNEADPALRVPSKFVWPSAVMALASVAIFVGAGPIFGVTNRAADNLLDTTAYVSTVLGANQADDDLIGGPGPIGQVLDPGPSGMANLPSADEPAGVSEVATDNAEAEDKSTEKASEGAR